MQVGKLKTNDFKDLRFNGTTFKTKNFLFVFSTLNTENTDKVFFGSTVTKKVGNAVSRNRSKRIIREVMRNALSSQNFSEKPGYSPYKSLHLNIVVLKNSKDSISYAHAAQQVTKFFKSLHFSS